MVGGIPPLRSRKLRGSSVGDGVRKKSQNPHPENRRRALRKRRETQDPRAKPAHGAPHGITTSLLIADWLPRSLRCEPQTARLSGRDDSVERKRQNLTLK